MSKRPGMMIGQLEHAVEGQMLQVGDPAPDFKLTANDWTMKTLADYKDKIKILSIVPSLDTRVCSAQTRYFNQEAAAFGEDVVVLTVSADLPYAQRRWCGAEGIERVITLSDPRICPFPMPTAFTSWICAFASAPALSSIRMMWYGMSITSR